MSNFLDMDLMIKIDAKTSRPFDLFEVIFQKGVKNNVFSYSNVVTLGVNFNHKIAYIYFNFYKATCALHF